MSYSAFHWTELREIIKQEETRRPLYTFLSDAFFPNMRINDENHIVLQKYTTGKNYVAQYSTECGDLPVVAPDSSASFLTVPPPFYGISPRIDCQSVHGRKSSRSGELLTSFQSKKILLIAEATQDARESFLRFREQMAAGILVNGRVEISDDPAINNNYGEVNRNLVDFQRDALNYTDINVDLGFEYWDTPNAMDMFESIQYLCDIPYFTGGACTDMIVSPKIWDAIRRHHNINDIIERYSIANLHPDTRTLRDLYGVQGSHLDGDDLSYYTLPVGAGGLGSNIKVWVYGGSYLDANQVRRPYIPEDRAILVNRDSFSGQKVASRHFSFDPVGDTIQDIYLREETDKKSINLEFFSKTMLLPRNIDAVVSAKVIA